MNAFTRFECPTCLAAVRSGDAHVCSTRGIQMRARTEAYLTIAGNVELLRRTTLQECTEACDDEWCSHALYGVETEGWNAALDAVIAMLVSKVAAQEVAS